MRARTRHAVPLRLLAAGAVAVATIAAGATGASAHVSVHAVDPPAAPGAAAGTTVISFRVPNERGDAATTGIRVQFPRDHPVVSATVRPKPGWTVQITRMPLTTPVVVEGTTISSAVDTIEWRGGTIGTGEYDEFEINAGPFLAGVDALTFPTVQSYDKGGDVAWIERAAPGGPEPARPAPVLELRAATPAATTTVPSAEHDMAGMATPVADVQAISDRDDGTRTLALVAAVVSFLALAGVLLALLNPGRHDATRTGTPRPERGGPDPDPTPDPAAAAEPETENATVP
jgi:uncharacterized protein YcnI